ncbi:unnamed protein product [Periconia digitata]|uniref:Secreted protein n=1 Tax=Periconia digitata TaxID=1303443 RepID=A0A9W4UD56_9PLEO|nr:unnamed protein product [Periconia digitata]
MKATTIIALLAPLASVQATCYRSGHVWGPNFNTAMDAAARLCNDGALSGSFNANGVKSGCQTLENNVRAQYQVTYIGGGTSVLSPEECKFRLQNEIGGCEHGGQSDVGSWRFSSDPNSGFC